MSYELTDSCFVVQCRTSLVDGASRCYIVAGGFTLLGNGELEQATPEQIEMTRIVMNSGWLDDVHPAVKSVRFLDVMDNETFANEAGGDDNNNFQVGGDDNNNNNVPVGAIGSKSENGLKTWPWILIAGCILILISAIFLTRRKRRTDIPNDEFVMATSDTRRDAYMVDSVLTPDLPGDDFSTSTDMESQQNAKSAISPAQPMLSNSRSDSPADSNEVSLAMSEESSGRHPFDWHPDFDDLQQQDNDVQRGNETTAPKGLGQHDFL